VASIAGVPAGLLLAGSSASGWRAPFLILGAGSAATLLVAAFVMPSLTGHRSEDRAGLLELALHPPHLRAYLFITTLVFSGFCVVPFIAGYMVRTVGMDQKDLPLCGGRPGHPGQPERHRPLRRPLPAPGGLPRRVHPGLRAHRAVDQLAGRFVA